MKDAKWENIGKCKRKEKLTTTIQGSFIFKANYTFCDGTIIRTFVLVRMIVP